MRFGWFIAVVVAVGVFLGGCVSSDEASDWDAEIIESRELTIQEFVVWRDLMECMGEDADNKPTIHVAVAGSVRCGEVKEALACTTSPFDIVIDERYVSYPWEVFKHEAAHAKRWQIEGDPDAGHSDLHWFGGNCGVTSGVVIVLSETE